MLKFKILKFMSNDQKTRFLLGFPNINLYNLILSSKYKKLNFIDDFPIKISNIIGGKFNDKDFQNEYNNKSGNFNIILNNNKYYYKIERYSPLNDNEFKIIDLITIKDEFKNLVHCGTIQIDIKNKIANIMSLGNSNKCIKSKNNTKFKYGDIIFQIMISICKKENIKKIELIDNALLSCSNFNLSLNILKTLTHGIPHYIKYGFQLKDKDNKKIINENYNRYLSNPTINKELLLKKIKKYGNQAIYKQFIKVLNKIKNNEISITKFTKLITQDLTNNDYCDFVYKIYNKLYLIAGYKYYGTHEYELYL